MSNRVNFASIQSQLDYPDFLEIQLKSFRDFIKVGSRPEERKSEGLYKIFEENFPIQDTRNQFVLEFLDYYIDAPSYTIKECIERGLTYDVPLKVRFRLYCTDEAHEDFEDINQDIYIGNIPCMTPNGTFIINGAERVVVSQLHRSPGVFFGQSIHANGSKLYFARVIPFKGSWIEFSSDINNVLHAYIDRKKKVPLTTLFRAIGYERDKDIFELFGLAEEIKVNKTNLKKAVGRTLAERVLRSWYEDFSDEDTGEVISIERNEVVVERDVELDEAVIQDILDSGLKTILLHKEEDKNSEYALIYNTLKKDPTNSEKEAVEYIYRQLRNSDPPDEETARGIIDKLFFSEARYNLGEVGRYRINKKLELDENIDTKVLTREDIVEIVKYLIGLINSKSDIDDIDHLSNRRVKTVGEQLENQFSIGLARIARTVKERMNVRDNEVFTPIDLINSKTLVSVITSFFATNQLSQFMDQTNPLAEVTHKRRLSALGPGGLSRDRAGFEVRDVHYTHYGRLCPIETPEGPNIGLISSLCVYAKVNRLGFIETPYLEVKEGVADLSKPVYLSAEEEEGKIIAQANVKFNEKGEFDKEHRVKSRLEADYPVVPPTDLHFMDVASNQIASISASLIPFLEHDDANRALMGSNMMRQAVPLLSPQAPIVGTGLERRLAQDSRVLINADEDGVVESVDANKIVVKLHQTETEKLVSFDSGYKEYNLIKFRKTNQSTTVNLKPIVKKGDEIKQGQVLCEGYATQDGELALGRNLRVAFMPWKGYNFEDAIVISEKVVREDWFTSIHIDEYSLDVRDTKLGVEELTADIPNISEDATRNLDENGMIRIGAEVNPGDILIGKITPKGEADPTPEEKLLKAIFGDKAGEVKDASLKASPSTSGIVVDKKLFSKSSKDKKKRAENKEKVKVEEAKFEANTAALRDVLVDKLYAVLEGKKSDGVDNDSKETIVKKGEKYTKKVLQRIQTFEYLEGQWVADAEQNEIVEQIIHNYKQKLTNLRAELKREKYNISIGDELPAGVEKLGKIYIANKRKLKVGDKMAGRHGNKGIVARIVREEDMPFLDDGSAVDIVLNPLGVPSRMNLGQIYETVLGWAGYKLGKKYATPIFDGATLAQIKDETTAADVPEVGRTYLFDGGTGEQFDQPATVGVIYMIKLGHLIEDKMHARSIGPYSLITQQPLGGKAQFGGQRLGEMEVWALEAFGASNILREMLTVKSDDVIGRAKSYEAIVKGTNLPEPSIPESFKVLMHEMKGLGLNINLEE